MLECCVRYILSSSIAVLLDLVLDVLLFALFIA
jgi:hypothetical protein